jgi:hypothetical protein
MARTMVCCFSGLSHAWVSIYVVAVGSVRTISRMRKWYMSPALHCLGVSTQSQQRQRHAIGYEFGTIVKGQAIGQCTTMVDMSGQCEVVQWRRRGQWWDRASRQACPVFDNASLSIAAAHVHNSDGVA